MEDFKNIVKYYFFELGNELSELLTNIWITLTTKKWIIVELCIIAFILGCFIWRPLCILTITGLFMMLETLCVMLIPIILTIVCVILFNLHSLDGEEPKYPILNTTLCFICSIIVFCISTYLSYDWAIRDIWYKPELWNQILSL